MGGGGRKEREQNSELWWIGGHNAFAATKSTVEIHNVEDVLWKETLAFHIPAPRSCKGNQLALLKSKLCCKGTSSTMKLTSLVKKPSSFPVWFPVTIKWKAKVFPHKISHLEWLRWSVAELVRRGTDNFQEPEECLVKECAQHKLGLTVFLACMPVLNCTMPRQAGRQGASQAALFSLAS